MKNKLQTQAVLLLGAEVATSLLQAALKIALLGTLLLLLLRSADAWVLGY